MHRELLGHQVDISDLLNGDQTALVILGDFSADTESQSVIKTALPVCGSAGGTPSPPPGSPAVSPERCGPKWQRQHPEQYI